MSRRKFIPDARTVEWVMRRLNHAQREARSEADRAGLDARYHAAIRHEAEAEAYREFATVLGPYLPLGPEPVAQPEPEPDERPEDAHDPSGNGADA